LPSTFLKFLKVSYFRPAFHFKQFIHELYFFPSLHSSMQHMTPVLRLWGIAVTNSSNNNCFQ
jgi:hypothetical protein